MHDVGSILDIVIFVFADMHSTGINVESIDDLIICLGHSMNLTHTGSTEFIHNL